MTWIVSGSTERILGRRFTRSGSPIGSLFYVQDPPMEQGANHSLAADADGDFVVVWFRTGGSVMAQRFDDTASPRGGSFEVTKNGYYDNAVAMNAGGSFVVAWASYFDLTKARRYDGAGNALGSEFPVGDFGRGLQPATAMADDGSFVVAWRAPFRLYAQRFDGAGSPVGASFPVDDTTPSGTRPVMDMAADGSFVIAWQEEYSSGNVFAQRYDSAGGRLGSAFKVNRAGLPLGGTSVAMTDEGDFFVFWTCCLGDATSSVLGQRFNRLGGRVGPEFVVNGPGAALRTAPSAAIAGNGPLMVAWMTDWPDDDEIEILTTRRYELAASGDADGDGIPNGSDNCPTAANPEQTDDAGDGYGDDCVSPDVVIPASSSFGLNPVIGAGTTVLDGVTVGDDAVLGEHVHLDRLVTIGNGFTAEDLVTIGRRARIGDDVTIGFATRIEGGVRIGNAVTIGDRVVIRRSAVVGDGATVEPLAVIFAGARIGAGAIVEMGARIGRRAIVPSGAVVPAGTTVPPGVTFP